MKRFFYSVLILAAFGTLWTDSANAQAALVDPVPTAETKKIELKPPEHVHPTKNVERFWDDLYRVKPVTLLELKSDGTLIARFAAPETTDAGDNRRNPEREITLRLLPTTDLLTRLPEKKDKKKVDLKYIEESLNQPGALWVAFYLKDCGYLDTLMRVR